MTKHLFFDLDRTLWDFEKNSETALQMLYRELALGDHLRSFRSFHTTYKKVNAQLWDEYSKGRISKDLLRVKRFRDTLAHFQVKNDDLSEQLATGYVKRSPHQTNLLPHTMETLHHLTDEGYAMHIITNGFKEVQFIKLEKSGLIPFFDIILCSEEAGANKPARIVFDQAMEQANARPENSVMIGDNYHADIIGAENAGMRAIFFDPQFQREDTSHKWIIRKLSEIPELLPFVWSKPNG